MMAKKPFALRIDEKMMQAVEKWAEDEFRSTNGQIEWIIHEALKKHKRVMNKKGQDN
ncbi:Arc family DNA-binding protein [Belliella pelovolcani]|uniref:Arc family DNA-binding protein n=1 Tax=Belliella pelovolcani TaxID=529505 RepID=UPI00391DEEE0